MPSGRECWWRWCDLWGVCSWIANVLIVVNRTIALIKHFQSYRFSLPASCVGITYHIDSAVSCAADRRNGESFTFLRETETTTNDRPSSKPSPLLTTAHSRLRNISRRQPFDDTGIATDTVQMMAVSRLNGVDHVQLLLGERHRLRHPVTGHIWFR